MLENLKESLRRGNSGETRKNVIKALAGGYDYQDILNAMIEVMDIVGKKFRDNEIFVPEVLFIGRSFNIALDVLTPLIDISEDKKGLVVIGTVKGDLHDIGKNLVKMMIIGTGCQVIDLGVDVSPEKFVDAVKEHKPDILVLSALLTTTTIQMKHTIKALEENGIRDSLKVMIGGAPVTQHYAENIGADHYTKEAATAAEVAKEIINEKYF